jgi:hypothetical protein
MWTVIGAVIIVVILLIVGASYATSQAAPIYSPEVKIPDSYVTTGCDQTQPISLSCPADTVITSGDIRYGRWDPTVCPHPTVNSNVKLYDETFPIPAQYLGQNSATIPSHLHIVLAKDPLPNVYKQYSVKHYCGASSSK